MIISRLAPTPSGYLHLGNALNFVLTFLHVKAQEGILKLRIDDFDAARCRREYVDDIFKTVDWLELPIDDGPSSSDDFFKHYSQKFKYNYYKEQMYAMQAEGATLYTCSCSRKKLQNYKRYPGFCRNSTQTLQSGHNAMRIAVKEESLAQSMGDFILWRRDNIPAYQLVSLIEDRDAGVNLIVRGKDLLQSSQAQRYLAQFAHAKTFENARFIHHELITRNDGSKFSKSDHDYALHVRRNEATKQKLFTKAAQLCNIPPQESLKSLLYTFKAVSP
jgi:glutamyl/glutaminyl-tRNA synthetase